MLQKKYIAKFLLVAFLLVKPIGFYAQCNLVPNPGAETGPCPTNQDQVPNATSWTKAGGSPDYFDNGTGCSGSTWTASYFRACSKRMIGFYTEWTPYNSQTPQYREYAQVKLTSPLVAGTRYCVTFYTRLAGNMGGVNTGTDNLGAYFTTTAVTAPSPPGNGPYNITPQIESPKTVPIVAANGWVLVSGSFIAVGGEQYVTFGNFHNQANTTYSTPAASMRSYYFIDDILVKDCNASCTFNATVTPATSICAGKCTTISATVTGGNGGPYTYTWSPNIGTGLGPFTVCPTSTTTYNFTAVDANGCTQTVVASTTITVGASCGPTVTTTSSNVCSGSCANITATGNGGTAPYTYSWNPGTGTSSSFSVCPTTTTTTYTVITTDANNATASATAMVTVNAAATVTITGTNAICKGSSTTLTASGGGTYSWSTGAGTTAITVSPATNTTYSVTGTIGGCTSSAIITVTVTPNPIPIISGITTICSGTSTTLTATGGGSYVWSTGDLTAATTVSPGNGTTTYTVTVTNNNCSGTAPVAVTVAANLVPVLTGTSTICNGASTMVSTSGGGTYLWSDNTTNSSILVNPTVPTSYSVTVTNGSCSGTASVLVTVVNNPTPIITGNTNVCSGTSTTLTANGGNTYVWDNGASTTSISVSPSSQTTYTVIANTSGCTGQTTVTVSITPPPNPTITGTTAICVGGSTTLTATAGGTYVWSTGETTASITVTPTNPTNTYTVTVTTGCTATATVQVTVQSNLVPIITGVNTICDGTNTTLTTSGGGTYLWSDGSTGPSITVSPTTNTTYSVTVTNGLCSGTAAQPVTVNPIPVPIITGNMIICSGQTTTLIANAGGTYLWNTGAATATITVSPTVTTSYTVTVITNGCSGIATAQVTVNTTPTPTITGITSICNGQVTTLTSGTTGPYVWNTGATSANISVAPVNTTTYSVSVTQNGCTGTSNITVTVISPVNASIKGNDICAGQSVTLTASGGTNYLWNTGSTTNPLTDSPTATITYTVIASTGSCVDTAIFTVKVNPLPSVSATGNATISYGNNTPLTATGGGTYQWIPPNGLSCTDCANPIATPTANTQYCVIIKNTAGCADSACVTITIDTKCGDNGELYVPNGFSPNGDGQNDALYVRGDGIADMYWAIYDRWGEKVFETSNPKQGWDGTYKGKALDPSVFVYYLKVTCFSGTEISKKGNVAIIK